MSRCWRPSIERDAAVDGLPHLKFGELAPGGGFTCAALIRGAAADDLYHAGQVQLIKRLAPR